MCKKRDKTLDAEFLFLFQSRAETTQHGSILFSRRATVNTVSFFESVPVEFFVAVGYPAPCGSLATEFLAKHLPVGTTGESLACERATVIPSDNAIVRLYKDATIGIDHMSGFVTSGDLAVSSVAPIEREHVSPIDCRSILQKNPATAVFYVFENVR